MLMGLDAEEEDELKPEYRGYEELRVDEETRDWWVTWKRVNQRLGDEFAIDYTPVEIVHGVCRVMEPKREMEMVWR